MREYPHDHHRVLDCGDDLEFAPPRATLDVDAEHAFELPRPTHPRRSTVLVHWRAAVVRGRRDDRSAQFGMWGEHRVEADQVRLRAWQRGGQALHELLGLHDDMGRAVAIRALQLQHDLALGVAPQAFVGDRGAGDVRGTYALLRGEAHGGV
jgi:hypothetical protein